MPVARTGMITPLSPAQLEEVKNLAAEMRMLDEPMALARALELIRLRELLRACRARHPYAALEQFPPRGMEQAWYREKIIASLGAGAPDVFMPDLVTLANRE